MPNPANLGYFFTTANATIGAAYGELQADSIKAKIADDVGGAGDRETLLFGWTGKLAKARVWTGPRVVNEPNPETYSVNYLPYEHTLAIDQFRLQDSGGNYGIYFRMLQDQVHELDFTPDYWLRDLIEGLGAFTSTSGNGNRQLGYDGLTHWNTAHPVNVYNSALGTYFNDTVGASGFTPASGPSAGIQVGGPFGTVAFSTILEYMPQIRGQDNEPLRSIPTLLMHPTTLTTSVDVVLKAEFFGAPTFGTITGMVGTSDNVLRKRGVEPLENPLLTNTTRYYMMNMKLRTMRPFRWWPKESPNIVPLVSPTDPNVVMLHQLIWAGMGKGAPIWGFPFLCVRGGAS